MSITSIYDYKMKGTRSQYLVFMLHGVGSHGRDLISLAPMLAQHVPQALFLSPDAPFACDMVPAGYPDAYQWFSLQNRDPDVMLSGVKAAFPLVEEMITAQCEKYDIPLDKVVMLGFSQGTMTSLYVAPRLKDKIAGVIGFSGALLNDPQDDAASLQKPPMHLIHGEADDVVPVAAWSHAKDMLAQQGFAVSGHTTRGLPHSIDQAGIDSAGAFLKSVLKGA